MKLGLIALIDEGMRLGLPEAPMVADLFEDLGNLMDATVSGSRLGRLKPEDSRSGFRVSRDQRRIGENLGRLNMLYLKKPIPSTISSTSKSPHPSEEGWGTASSSIFAEFLDSQSALGISRQHHSKRRSDL